MQLSNLVLRLGGSLLHTVPVSDATPAEILVLQRIHGDDAVVDVRPVRMDKNRRHAQEFERLAAKYDRAASASAPGDESKSIMASLFPGAMKKLPLTLKDIGLGHYMSPASIAAAERQAASVAVDPAEGEEAVLNPPAPEDSEDGAGEDNLAGEGADDDGA